MALDLVVGDPANLDPVLGRNIVYLEPDAPGQFVEVIVSGGEPVPGFNLIAQINDGGLSVVNGPVFGAIDLKPARGIFADVADPQIDFGTIPQIALWFIALITPGDTRSADGLVATMEIDTTGLNSGLWPLLVGSDSGSGGTAVAGDSDFAGLAATSITNAQLRIPQFTWTSPGGGLWTADNWDQPDFPNGKFDLVVLGDAISGPGTVVTDIAVTAKSITFDIAFSYTVGGTESVTMEANAGMATVHVTQSRHDFQSSIQLGSDTEVNVADNASLALNGDMNLHGHGFTKTGPGELQFNQGFAIAGGVVNVLEGIVAGNGGVGGNLHSNCLPPLKLLLVKFWNTS